MEFDEQIKTCRKLGIDRAVDSMQGKDMITSAHILKLAFNLDSNQLIDLLFDNNVTMKRNAFIISKKEDNNAKIPCIV